VEDLQQGSRHFGSSISAIIYLAMLWSLDDSGQGWLASPGKIVNRYGSFVDVEDQS